MHVDVFRVGIALGTYENEERERRERKKESKKERKEEGMIWRGRSIHPDVLATSTLIVTDSSFCTTDQTDRFYALFSY